MESYIVRVIRRNQAERGKYLRMEGVAESVESRERQGFHSAIEPFGACARLIKRPGGAVVGHGEEGMML